MGGSGGDPTAVRSPCSKRGDRHRAPACRELGASEECLPGPAIPSRDHRPATIGTGSHLGRRFRASLNPPLPSPVLSAINWECTALPNSRFLTLTFAHARGDDCLRVCLAGPSTRSQSAPEHGRRIASDLRQQVSDSRGGLRVRISVPAAVVIDPEQRPSAMRRRIAKARDLADFVHPGPYLNRVSRVRAARRSSPCCR